MNTEFTTKNKVVSLFIQCLLLVKVTTVKDASNFLNVLNENSGSGFDNIFELINACNDKLCTLLMEVVLAKGDNGVDLIGIKSNVNSETCDFINDSKDGFGILNLGLRKIKDSNKIKGI
ncbi:hypothetical protein OIY81_781 [Cryptosporidium canis]|uniref:Uncharacterized protein n=1 Tax=Cryptosporidium canis TaxID=195482 RepID=A0ABQ8P7S2_9CRYT|nr:hypothetical protein OJ252_1581 [Cryptosporidium canis]KAJ1613876.1 hypothetical protein OIY81_781 [Cryptosporidium canis]